MYLGIRTDSAEASFFLYEGSNCIALKKWQADRSLAKDLLSEMETFLKDNDQDFKSLAGLFVYEGPGSFTGLRIGITVMNSLAYGLSMPIVGTSGESWDKDAVNKLTKAENDQSVLPMYGADPRITKPSK